MTNTITHGVNNEAFAGSGGSQPVTNPATGQVTGQVALATVEDARTVIDAAVAAFPSWRDTSLAKRASILFNFRELLKRPQGELAEIITSEHGKVVTDAVGEVSRGQEVVEFACGVPHLLKGWSTVTASTQVDVHSIREPLGPVVVISSLSLSPAMVPMSFFPIAIAAGNTVVLKPSEKVPSAAVARRTLEGSRAAAGRVQRGARRKTAVDELLTHPRVQAVCFVGSTPIARHVYATGTAQDKRVQALGGAKNHVVILPDADLDLAADGGSTPDSDPPANDAWRSAYASPSAPAPTPSSRRSPHAPHYSRPATAPGTPDMGPLVTTAHRDHVASYIDAGEADGAKLVVDGRSVTPEGGKTVSWSARP